MKTLATLGLILVTLAGCAPQTIYTPIESDVPVIQKCTPPVVQPPDLPLKALPANSTIFDKVRAALIEIDNRQIYEDQLSASLKACGG